MRLLRSLALGGVIAAWTAGVPAGTASAVFNVNITLNSPATQSLCISQASNATVQVACSSGQFVSIEAAPGQQFLGSQGSAYRLWFGPGSPLPQAQAAKVTPYLVTGTVTQLQLRKLNEQDEPLEILVSF